MGCKKRLLLRPKCLAKANYFGSRGCDHEHRGSVRIIAQSARLKRAGHRVEGKERSRCWGTQVPGIHRGLCVHKVCSRGV